MRLIDADKLCKYLSDLFLQETPDERMSSEERKEAIIRCDIIDEIINLIDASAKNTIAAELTACLSQLEGVTQKVPEHKADNSACKR